MTLFDSLRGSFSKGGWGRRYTCGMGGGHSFRATFDSRGHNLETPWGGGGSGVLQSHSTILLTIVFKECSVEDIQTHTICYNSCLISLFADHVSYIHHNTCPCMLVLFCSKELIGRLGVAKFTVFRVNVRLV